MFLPPLMGISSGLLPLRYSLPSLSVTKRSPWFLIRLTLPSAAWTSSSGVHASWTLCTGLWPDSAPVRIST
jgi:hypothetical protein